MTRLALVMVLLGACSILEHLAYYGIPIHWAWYDHGTAGMILLGIGCVYLLVRSVKRKAWWGRGVEQW